MCGEAPKKKDEVRVRPRPRDLPDGIEKSKRSFPKAWKFPRAARMMANWLYSYCKQLVINYTYVRRKFRWLFGFSKIIKKNGDALSYGGKTLKSHGWGAFHAKTTQYPAIIVSPFKIYIKFPYTHTPSRKHFISGVKIHHHVQVVMINVFRHYI